MKQVLVLVIAALIVFPCKSFAQYDMVVYAVGDNFTLLQAINEMECAPISVDPPFYCSDFRSVWGSSEHDIYVAGCNNDLLHFNGMEWSTITLATPAHPYVYIAAVSGTGPDNVYAVGSIPGPSSNGISYHFDGLGWSEITGGGSLQRVWADPGGGFYAISSHFSEEFPLEYYQSVKRYKDGAWFTESLVQGFNPDPNYDDEYHRISGRYADRPIVTGYWDWVFFDEYMQQYHVTGGAVHTKEADGTWSYICDNVPCGQYATCPIWSSVWHAVYCVSEYEIWFAGENGMVVRWTPWGEQEYDLQLPITFRAIWIGPGNNVYIAGDYGYLVHYYNGWLWLVMDTYTTEHLNDVWGYHIEEVATKLQSFSTGVDESGITVRWSLSGLDEGTRFRITRTALHESFALLTDEDPDLEREGLSFTYVDADVEPGGAYKYLIECSGEAGRHTLFETGAISTPEARFALLPNYPNPFNPSTTITYSVPARCHVAIHIFDVAGNIVRSLLDAEQPPGRYTIRWDGLSDRGHEVASGTYFCRLTAGKQSLSRKMLLMR